MNFKNLKLREKIILIALGGAILFGAYMKMVHRTFSKKIETQALRIKKYETQIKDLKVKHPALDEQRARIANLGKACDQLSGQIGEMEKKLPSRKDTSQLIGEFTRLATRAKLLSIRQKTLLQEGYNRILIEVTLSASYPDAIFYLSRIESISPFLKIEEIDINETKGKSVEEGGAPVRIMVSSLLGDAASSGQLKASEEELEPIKRNILLSKNKGADVLSEKDFKLEGITYNPQTPTVIINGDVFRIDSEIKGYKIKDIRPDSVVLTDGLEDHLLKLRPVNSA